MIDVCGCCMHRRRAWGTGPRHASCAICFSAAESRAQRTSHEQVNQLRCHSQSGKYTRSSWQSLRLACSIKVGRVLSAPPMSVDGYWSVVAAEVHCAMLVSCMARATSSFAELRWRPRRTAGTTEATMVCTVSDMYVEAYPTRRTYCRQSLLLVRASSWNLCASIQGPSG